MLRALASSRLTLAGLAALAVAVLLTQRYDLPHGWTLIGPLALLSVNLLAALFTHRRFRQQRALLVFHVALLALVGLVAVSRLTYLGGVVALVEGVPFSGRLDVSGAGPLHFGRLADLHLVNEGVELHYAPGGVPGPLANRVRWSDEAGQERVGIIGDHYPLTLHGYRFYTTGNMGFAPLLRWWPAGGAPVDGSVTLPAFPRSLLNQHAQLQLPGLGGGAALELVIESAMPELGAAYTFAVPQRAHLRLQRGGRTWRLDPGAALEWPEGRLEYRELRTWQGYQVHYDFTRPWLLLAGGSAIASLAVYLVGRWRARPWWQAGGLDGVSDGASDGANRRQTWQ